LPAPHLGGISPARMKVTQELILEDGQDALLASFLKTVKERQIIFRRHVM
jgi:hypothetical protein